MRTRDNRLVKLKKAIDASPVRRGVLNEAYEWFTMFGELPEDDDHVAYEVVQRALRGGEEVAVLDPALLAHSFRKARDEYQAPKRPAAEWPPTVRTLLFDEALFEAPKSRDVARAVIATEVAYGGDVESPGFAARYGIPMYGTVALHVHGWPRTLVKPPYEFQGKRLLARLDNVRGRMDPDIHVEAVNNAIAMFREKGELPNDELLLEAVLVHIELEELYGHKKGRDVAEVMAVLARVQRHDEEDAAAALRELCEMARAGMFR